MAPILIYSSPGRPCSQTNCIFANLYVVLTLLCEKMYELREKIISTLIILLSGLAAAANFNAILAILLTFPPKTAEVVGCANQQQLSENRHN